MLGNLKNTVMAKIERFEDLEIWKEAVAIGVDVYSLTSKGKLEKDFSSKDQLRRAAISISNNIAEGFEYNNNKSFINFLKFAKGSAGELRSNLFVLKEAKVVLPEEHDYLQDKLLKASRNISGFMKYLKNYEFKKR
jgi:four helix bundle protein